ncbi:MAG: alpha-amylase family glycosyl hydrolase [Candidatus Amulumruptor caecigallinarius]|nr:alpha-amylase family glycosyl hydrolase [Candidatus Amulumruptor caecigallinarius]
MERLIIYQAFPRIFTNTNSTCKPWGTYEENGSGKLNDITPRLLKSLKDMGVNCIWLTGVVENATMTSFADGRIPADNPNVVKGQAGSPYAIKDYYDVSPAIAADIDKRMKEFEDVVKRTHEAGMKLIIDFVPNHTARVYHSDSAPTGVKDFGSDDDITKFFAHNNNYYYITNQQFCPDFNIAAPGTIPYVEFPAKATGNDCFSAYCHKTDWYETVKLNYGYDPGDRSTHYDPIPDTWLKMLSVLRFWASKDVDGFRCDMVFMVPQEFWHWAIPNVKKDYPEVKFIGEIYDTNLYYSFLNYCGFDYLYDKVNLYDTLVGIECHNTSAARLTYCWQCVEGMGNSMLNFLENHDEVRFASREFAGDPSKVTPYLVVSSMISSGPFMIYYGQELGEPALDNEGFAGDNNRSTIFDYWSYDTLRRWYNNGKCSVSRLTSHEKWLRKLYSKVLNYCNSLPAIREGEFFDLMYVNLRNPGFNPHRQYAFIRYDHDEAYLIIANFDSMSVSVSLSIPDLAFDMCGIAEGAYDVKDLLWGKNHRFELHRAENSLFEIGAYDALILPLKKIVAKTCSNTK